MAKRPPKSKRIIEQSQRGQTRPYLKHGPSAIDDITTAAATGQGSHNARKLHARSNGQGAETLWISGRHASLAAAANPKRHVLRLLALSHQAQELNAAAEHANSSRPAVEVIDRQNFAHILPQGNSHQGFAVLATPLRPPSLDDILDLHAVEPELLLVLLDHASDPRNVGAVLRSAAAFGAAALITQDRHAPRETGALAKAACGALESVPLVRVTNIARALRTMRERAIECIGLDHNSHQFLSDVSLPRRLAVVVGAEGSGLRRLVRESCNYLVGIPIVPAVESLNLSVAASLAMYTYRQGQS